MKRPQGSGSLYCRRGCARWEIQYYRDGRRMREATHFTSRIQAELLLKQRLRDLRENKHITALDLAGTRWCERLINRCRLDGVLDSDCFNPRELSRWGQPAVYVFCDRAGHALYVGKAHHGIRRFADPRHHRAAVRMLATEVRVLWCATAQHATHVERLLIRALHPRYNFKRVER